MFRYPIELQHEIDLVSNFVGRDLACECAPWRYKSGTPLPGLHACCSRVQQRSSVGTKINDFRNGNRVRITFDEDICTARPELVGPLRPLKRDWPMLGDHNQLNFLQKLT